MRATNKIRPKSDTTDNANFIRDTFHRRECTRFVATDVCQCRLKTGKNRTETPASEDVTGPPIAESVCKCGHSRTMHSNKATVGPAIFNTSNRWNVEDDTEVFPTNAYGKLEFDESEKDKPFNKPTIKRFVRLDYKTNPDKMVKLFRDYWKMDQPQLLLSVTSSYKRKKEDPEKITEFCKQLVEAATQTNAWIITEGTMEGIGGVVGDKIEEVLDREGKRPKAVLSICNWGSIRDKHRLIKENKHKDYSATPSISVGCCDKNAPREVSLDRNHTNFLLVDDGRQFHPGCERLVRQKLEFKLMACETEHKVKSMSAEDSIPLIYFLIGGDDNEIEYVKRAIANNIPVIVAEGTGGAADKIATEYIKKPSLFQIEESKRKLLIIFDTTAARNGSEDLSLCILSVLKVTNDNPTHVFVLAADWDNKLFFTNLLREKPKGCDLEDVMCKLLLKNSHSYVEVLLDSGVNLVEVVKEIFKDSEFTEYMENKSFVKHLVHQITSEGNDLSQTEVDKIGKLLCIWSTYNGMTEMAKVFWRAGKDYLAMALLAYKVSTDQTRKLAGKQECNAMLEQKKVFQKVVTDFLKTCDEASRRNTIDLLRGRVPDLNQHTPMQLAFDGDFQEFVAKPSFQELLDQIWVKRIINYHKMMYIPMIVAVFCPFVAPSLFEYREGEKLMNNLDDSNPTMQSFLYFFWKVREFLSAPVIKFVYNALTYLGYLVLFSIVMLTDFRTKMSPSEITLTVWTSILIMEAFRQAAIFRREFLNKWNLCDVFALTLYVIGFVLRITHQSSPHVFPTCLYVARIILSFSLLLSILRVLQILSINSVLGPKIYMIGGLLRDLLGFLLILATFVSAYGIVSNIILYPNQPLDAKLLRDVFYDAWWSVVQQFNRDDALGLNCNLDETPSNISNISNEYCSSPADFNVDYVACKKQKCPANTWLVSVMLVFYAYFTVIMMLNVLIAMFNVTFTTVESKQNVISKMQRYRLIREYHFRSMFPAPLCVIAYLKYIPWLWKLCNYCCCTDDDYDGEMHFPPQESAKNMFSKRLVPVIKIWEQSMLEKYEEEIRTRAMSEFAAVVPRGNDFNIVLNSPNYFNTLMQSVVTQIEEKLNVYFDSPDRKDGEAFNATKMTGGEASNRTKTKDGEASNGTKTIDGEKSNATKTKGGEASNRTKTKGGEKSNATQTKGGEASNGTKTKGLHIPERDWSTFSERWNRDSKDDETSNGTKAKDGEASNGTKAKEYQRKPKRGHKKRNPRSAITYADRYRRSHKGICTNPDCKMIIKCRNGRKFEVEKPFSDGVSLDLSKLPAKTADIITYDFICKDCQDVDANAKFGASGMKAPS